MEDRAHNSPHPTRETDTMVERYLRQRRGTAWNDFITTQKDLFHRQRIRYHFASHWGLFVDQDNAPVDMSLLSDFAPGTVIVKKRENICRHQVGDDYHNREHWFTATIGGRGTWYDVWTACDTLIRNDPPPPHRELTLISGFSRRDSKTYEVRTEVLDDLD